MKGKLEISYTVISIAPENIKRHVEFYPTSFICTVWQVLAAVADTILVAARSKSLLLDLNDA